MGNVAENKGGRMAPDNLENEPGKPIVTRHKGAHFYCLDCGKEYRKCKCSVYVSADTLPKETPRGTKSGTPSNGTEAL